MLKKNPKNKQKTCACVCVTRPERLLGAAGAPSASVAPGLIGAPGVPCRPERGLLTHVGAAGLQNSGRAKPFECFKPAPQVIINGNGLCDDFITTRFK